MGIFTIIENIEFRNRLTLWYPELDFHGCIEWEGIVIDR